MTSFSGQAFFGRESELAAVFDVVGRVPAAGLVTVVVSGEPGIGKSSLLAETCRRLRDRGCPVAVAESDDVSRRIPYAAVATALRSVPVTGDVQAALDALDLTSTPDASWFGRSCELVARVLTGLTAQRPAALVLDDLDQVDDDSLAMLAVVLRRVTAAPLVLITAARTHHHNPGVGELLDRLERHAEVVRVELAPLSGGDVARIVETVLGTPVDDGLAHEVHQRADGNPFFAVEIARSLRELDLVAVDGNRARLTVSPSAIRLTRREAVLRRVAPLDRDTRAVARAVSIFRRVRLDQIGLLARVSSLPEDTVVDAFDGLLRAHIVVRDDDRGYRFSHALVGEALYQEIGPAQRRHLHSLISARLLDDRERGLAVDEMELAWHLAESAPPGDLRAIRVMAQAAAANRTTAPETAAALCARALELLPVAAPERAGLLASQCRALAHASRPAAAIAPGLAALDVLPPGPDRSRCAVVVLTSLFLVGRMTEALRLADAELATGNAPAALHAQRALLLVFTGRHAEALAAADRIEAMPFTSAAEGVVVFDRLAVITSMLFRHDKTVEYANRSLRSAAGQPILELQALAVGASTGALAGLVHDATWRLRRAEELRERTGGHAFRGELEMARVALDWFGGAWDACLERVGRAAAELESRQELMMLDGLRAIELEVRTWRGELDVAARLAALTPPTSPNMSRLHALAMAGYLAARGDVERARTTLVEAVDDDGMTAYSCVLLGRLIELDLAHGREEEARQTVKRLCGVAADRVAPWTRATVRRVHGLTDRDADVLREAVREAEAGGLVFEKARAQLALGVVDREAVPELLDAYALFQRLGAHGLRRQAGGRLRELGAKVPRARAKAPGVLTEAEENVARLVQQGMRNRDIAAALHYSPRTIEVYLSRIYAKLHVSSRLELARALDARA
ncbi:DNA-binding CsgD family transcriptional regulator [Saccharothrix ecbatanensis]|uniref:DNA-binding CsgD family transcriptional regulator n=1 Tax=Saccharothrix ecbatanensis TaxID=1105145 RepID=A0A7W9M275_9PSEU|nr:LuxR family transcriptional regulator [Saccharothrix ecbatanensis]MBB5804715.1 DNA-binding CsgD family transcriptional regulator [Saccharothrix ecbatanensis]